MTSTMQKRARKPNGPAVSGPGPVQSPTRCLALPQVLAALSTAGPVARVDDEKLKALGQLATETCRRIVEELGGRISRTADRAP